MRMAAIFQFLAVFLLFSTVAAAKSPPDAWEGDKLALWLPPGLDTAKDKTYPLILFSHGFHGCATQSTFLMRALADDGYIVAAPDHKDASCKNDGSGTEVNMREWRRARFRERMAGTESVRPPEKFGKPENWTAEDGRYRADEIVAAVVALQNGSRFGRMIDWRRVGFAGHSFGGYTVVGMTGGWPGWPRAHVRAVLALSPYVSPYVTHGTLKNVDVPVMYQGGTRDYGVTPVVRRDGGAYDMTPQPRYYVEFDKTGHFGWSDLQDGAHDGIAAYALAFFARHVKGEAAPLLDAAALPGVTAYRHDAGAR